MITWLASYPRSGNTLVRTILNRCFGFKSYEREELLNEVADDYITNTIGHLTRSGAWEEFYAQAAVSPEPVFIKTHLPPEDGNPAVYVVRSGRAAITSYFHHFREFSPGEERNLLELVLGHDHYGDWTRHYRGWDPEVRPKTLVVRFERLLQQPGEEIARIGAFIGFQGCPGGEWTNPFERLQCDDPVFFRRGKAEWTPDAAWTPEIEEVFQVRHGTLMKELGYGELDPAADFVRAGHPTRAAFVHDLDELARRSRAARAEFEEAAALRYKEQVQLTQAVQEMKSDADERLALIEDLRAAHEDLVAIAAADVRVLERIAGERLDSIDRLTGDAGNLQSIAQERLDSIDRLTEDVRNLQAIARGRLDLIGKLDTAAQERLRDSSELRREVELRDDAIAALRQAAEGSRVFETAATIRLAEMENLTHSLRQMERVAEERLRIVLRLESDLLRKDRLIRFIQKWLWAGVPGRAVR